MSKLSAADYEDILNDPGLGTKETKKSGKMVTTKVKKVNIHGVLMEERVKVCIYISF
jgi:hypothetical protein